MQTQLISEKKSFIWNMLGSTVYAVSSAMLTFLTIRIIGEKNGGIFGISLTLAQMFVYIAYFETRNFQVTDPKDRYTFAEYHTIKIVNCFFMMCICIIYSLMKKYDFYKMSVVLSVCFYRMLDGYADVYESEFHMRGRLDLAGKSLTFRTVFSVFIYFLILVYTKDLLLSVICSIICGIIGVILFDILVFNKIGKIGISFSGNKLIMIWKDCFPLFIGMFLWTYLLSASRIAVDNVMDSEYQAYYQILFLPVSVINLLAGFLIRPSLQKLTSLHISGKKKQFWKNIYKTIMYIVGFTVLCMIGAYLVGIPILELVVDCDLTKYRIMFVFLIFSGGINATGYILYYVLTIFRRRKSIVLGYAMASVVAFLISTSFTQKWELWGASVSYMIVVSVLVIIFTADIFLYGAVCQDSVKASSNQQLGDDIL